jgi:hypothetical protein
MAFVRLSYRAACNFDAPPLVNARSYENARCTAEHNLVVTDQTLEIQNPTNATLSARLSELYVDPFWVVHSCLADLAFDSAPMDTYYQARVLQESDED